MAEPLGQHLRQTDAFTMSLERDPLLRSTIVAVALFERPPDWDILVDRVDRATRLSPTFREKLTATPFGIAAPRWMVDPDFDLEFHLRRFDVPAPKTLDTVLTFARNAGMTAFDPARPMWEFTLLEGLTGGRAALVMKLHHALTDGIGGVQIAAHVVDLEPEPAELGPLPDEPVARRSRALDQLVDAIAFDLGHVVMAVRERTVALPRDVIRIVRDPAKAVGDAARTGLALARFVRPIGRTLSPVMTDRRLQWHFDTIDVSFADLKTAAKKADGTLNDAFVGGVTGGLRLYHERHGSSVEALRLAMPISIRREDDPEGGNRITLMRFEVPVGIEDPVERMREIDSRCAALREDPAIPWSNAVAGVLNLLPSSITGGMLKHVDFLASNVPGFGDTVYVGGAELSAFYAFGPTLGSAANITLMSYRDRCYIGVNTDVGAVPDSDLFMSCLREGFEEVLGLADPTRLCPQKPEDE
jgi:diacylglycerol O-acyltransferase